MEEIIGPAKQTKFTFSLEPAYNAIGSLSLFEMVDDFSGLGDWVYQTVGKMSPAQLRTNQLVLEDVHVHLADASWPSFSAWVDDLAAQDATEMRDRVLEVWLKELEPKVEEVPSTSEILSDVALYLSLVEKHSMHHGGSFERSYWEENHGLLNDPVTRQNLIVAHLGEMWDVHLSKAWEANLPMLEESVAAFSSLNFEGLTAIEAIDRVILREVPMNVHRNWLAEYENVIFIPSAHTGPYIIRLSDLGGDTTRILFGARIPEGIPARLPALNRSELLMRLNALADDTRLRILKLVAQDGELGTPEIIAKLEISQSSASRHLEHLTAVGYLTAQRLKGPNFYKLNPERMEDTFKALKEFLQ